LTPASRFSQIRGTPKKRLGRRRAELRRVRQRGHVAAEHESRLVAEHALGDVRHRQWEMNRPSGDTGA
jgi:hypothetical protein